MSEYIFVDYGSQYPEIMTYHYGYLIPVNIQEEQKDNYISYKAYQIYSLNLSTYELDKAFGELKELYNTDYKNAAFYDVRKKRNELLNQTDWMIARAVEKSEEIPETLKIYRQTLRDLPDLYDNPDDIVWPKLPN